MKKLLYLCEQRALVVNLTTSGWSIQQEYPATEAGVQALSRWLERQRWSSVLVLIDFITVSWELQSLPSMSGLTRLRYLSAQRRELRQAGVWWRLALLHSTNGDRECSLARLSLGEPQGRALWQPLLERHQHKIRSAYPALLLAGTELLPQPGNADTLLCASCSDQHYWHQFYRNGLLCYVRVLPLPKNPEVVLQQIEETLQYMETASNAQSPTALLVTDDLGASVQTMRKALGGHLVSSVLECGVDSSQAKAISGELQNIELSTTQQRLFDQFIAMSRNLRHFQLSPAGRFPPHCRPLVRCLVGTRVLVFLNLLLMLIVLSGLGYVSSMQEKLSDYTDTADRLSLVLSRFPAPAQQMRSTVLLKENLQADGFNPVPLLTNLAETVFTVPELVLKRIEWLAVGHGSAGSPDQLNISLVAEPYPEILVDEHAQSGVLVRLTGFITLNSNSINDSFSQYRGFRQALSGLPGVQLIADQVPYDSAAPKSVSAESTRNETAKFSILLGYEVPGLQ